MINIIVGLMVNSEWTKNFLNSEGHIVAEELLLSLLGSTDLNCEKIVIRLTQILSKVMEGCENFENAEKLYNKMIRLVREETTMKK